MHHHRLTMPLVDRLPIGIGRLTPILIPIGVLALLLIPIGAASRVAARPASRPDFLPVEHLAGSGGAISLPVPAPASARPAAPASAPATDQLGNFVRDATWEPNLAYLPPHVWREPSGIALGSSGRLFVSDARLKEVKVLKSDGTLITTFGRGTTPDDLVAPGHLAVDAKRNRVYIADPGAERVAVYSQEGVRVALWTGLAGVAGVAVAPDGRVLVTDALTDLVRLFNPDGTTAGSWGGSGDGPGQFDTPAGLDIAADGTVYVVDRGHRRVVALRMDGSPVAAYRLDDSRIQSVFVGLVVGEPLDVSYDSGAIWIATSSGVLNLNIQNSAQGVFVDGVLPSGSTRAIAIGPTYGLFVAVQREGEASGVLRYRYQQASGEPKAKWADLGWVLGYFDRPSALSVGDDGAAYVLDLAPRIQRLNGDGQALGQILTANAVVSNTSAISPAPVQVDADSDGNVYAVVGDSLFAYDAKGVLRWKTRIQIAVPDQRLAGFVAVAWDAAAREVLVLDEKSGQVYGFDAAGQPSRNWVLSSEDDALAYWSDLAVDSSGIRYALDQGNHELRGWDAAHRLVFTLDAPYFGLRFDVMPDGSFVLLSVDGWSYQLGRDGRVLARWDTNRLDRTKASSPADLATDAAGRVLVVDSGAGLVTVFSWDPTSLVPPPPSKGACGAMVHAKSVDAVTQCDEIPVDLDVQSYCQACPNGVNVVFVEVSTIRPYNEWQARESASVLDALAGHPELDARFAVIYYEDRKVTVAQPFSRSADRTRLSLARAPRTHYPDGDFIGAARIALNFLSAARAGESTSSDEACDLVVFFSYTKPEIASTTRNLVKAMDLLRRSGAALIVGCPHDFPRECDVPRMSARGRAEYTEYNQRGMLRRFSEVALDRFAQFAGAIKELHLTQILPTGLAYIDGSANPPPTGMRVEGGTTLLDWRWSPPVPGNQQSERISYRARPLQPGNWMIDGSLEVANGSGPALRVPAAVPPIAVTEKLCGPTLTPPPTATPLPTHTPTSTPLPTPTITPSPAPKPRPIYLPIMVNESCTQQWIYADVVLVLDLSTSMDRLTRSGRTKLNATQDAAKSFVARMDFSPNPGGQHDQVAVVGFNRSAWIQAELSNDAPAIHKSIDDLVQGQAQFTRLDLGFEESLVALRPERRKAGNTPVVIFLTDGLPNQVPLAEDGSMETTVLRAAERVKRAGVTVYTIAIGEPQDINPELLKGCASAPSLYRYTPDAEDLAAIYAEIAYAVGCPKERFWGRR